MRTLILLLGLLLNSIVIDAQSVSGNYRNPCLWVDAYGVYTNTENNGCLLYTSS